MIIRQKLLSSLALLLFTTSASAGAIVYVVTGSQQFGTVDLSSGAFTPIGPGTPEGESGLVPGSNGSLLTLTFSGNLDAIDPTTGVTTVIGATGLGNCTAPVPPQCGPNSAGTIGALGGNIFATDLANNLYSINPLTGRDTFIGATGIPAVPFLDGSTNADGTLNVFDADLFSANGNLYEFFDAQAINPNGPLPVIVNQIIARDLYRIDPATGAATLIGPTAAALTSIVNVNGTIYAFDGPQGDVVALNLTNGGTSFVSSLDPNAGIISGASPTPEPSSLVLAAIAMGGIGVLRKRRCWSAMNQLAAHRINPA